ncbi:hypothetical protein [Alishewanella longhuensis]
MNNQHKAGVALIAVLLLLKFAAQPWWQWQVEKRESIQLLQMNKNRLENLQDRVALLAQQQQVIDENFKLLNGLWLNDSVAQPQVLVLRHLERLAGQYQVELSARNIGDPIKAPLSGLPLSLFLSGHPQNVNRFLLDLESIQPVGIIYGIRFVKPRPFDKHITSTLDVLILIKPEEIS